MHTQTPINLVTHSPEETGLLGRHIGSALMPGDVLALIGDLGAGKTALTQGIFAGLGGDTSEVTSPTFVLMTPHHARLTLYHFDAYRLSGADEMLDIGADEFFFGDGACVIEWADRVAAVMPDDRLEIRIEICGETDRRFLLTPRGTRSSTLARMLTDGPARTFVATDHA